MNHQILNRLKNKQLIVFGAGKIGKSLINLLNQLEIKINNVWDNNFDKCDPLDNYSISKPFYDLPNKDEYIIVVTIYAQEVSKKIQEELISNGFTNIIYKREDLNSLFYFNCKNKIENNEYIFNLNTCHLCPCSKDINNRSLHHP